MFPRLFTHKKFSTAIAIPNLGALLFPNVDRPTRLMSEKPIIVSVVEDERDLSEGLRALLRMTPGLQFRKAYERAERALEELLHMPPDVLLMDIRLKGKDGVWLTDELCKRGYSKPIVMLSILDDEAVIFKALEVGAVGYLLKDAEPCRVLDAIRVAHYGGSPMSASIARMLVRRFQSLNAQQLPDQLPIERLSKREKELVSKLMSGRRYVEIADELHISVNTVKVHIRNIYEKLQINSRSELMARGEP